MEVITDAPSSREMEHRLNTLQTSLSMVERSITKFENLIENCQILEEEVRHIEEDEAHQKEEITNFEMAKEEERSDPESSGPCGEADIEGPLHWPPLKMLSPPRRMLSSCSQHPNLKIQWLDLTAPGVRPARSWERWLNCA